MYIQKILIITILSTTRSLRYRQTFIPKPKLKPLRFFYPKKLDNPSEIFLLPLTPQKNSSTGGVYIKWNSPFPLNTILGIYHHTHYYIKLHEQFRKFRRNVKYMYTPFISAILNLQAKLVSRSSAFNNGRG